MTTTASTLQVNKQTAGHVNHIPVTSPHVIKVALIDLYNGETNLGIQSIHHLVNQWKYHTKNIAVELHTFDTRQTGEAPGLEYDLYISSGGPGSPFDGEGLAWESAYFNWVDTLWRYNQSNAVIQGDLAPKHVLFICHSFQLMCRHFDVGEVTRRKSQSFGIFKTHPTQEGLSDPLFKGLQDPFYVADFRDWQVVHPHTENIKNLGATLLAIEKIRPNIPFERAIMGIRISKEMVGVQFHPEANPAGMLVHFQQNKRREYIIETHGEAKFNQIIDRIKAPAYLLHTYQRVIPNFLRNALAVTPDDAGLNRMAT